MSGAVAPLVAQIFEYVNFCGRRFHWQSRSTAVRRRAVGDCFRASALLALDGHGDYVEGVALLPGGEPVHHAWITVDGNDAIDSTWDSHAAVIYRGIKFDRKEIAHRILIATRHGPMIDENWLRRARSGSRVDEWP